MAISGRYAYVVSESGLLVVDIADPRNPHAVGSYHTTQSSAATYARDIAVEGSYAYVLFDVALMNAGRLEVIDIADSSMPTLAGRYDLELRFLGRLALAGNYVYVTDGVWTGGTGLYVIDISDRRNPKRVGGNSAFDAYGVAVWGDNVYTVANSEITILNKFRPPLQLTMSPFSFGTPLTISLSGPAGSTARLQRSANLQDWEDWVVLPLGEQPTAIGDPEAGEMPMRFYRAVEE